MSWFLLIVSGFFECIWAVALKHSEGFSRLTPTLVTIAALAISMVLLAKAAQDLPISTAYPVWVGLGALGTGILAVTRLGEPMGGRKIFFLCTLVLSIIGLKWS